MIILFMNYIRVADCGYSSCVAKYRCPSVENITILLSYMYVCVCASLSKVQKVQMVQVTSQPAIFNVNCAICHNKNRNINESLFLRVFVLRKQQWRPQLNGK